MKPRHILLALACILLWGCSFVVIRWGLHDLPPLLFASLRFAMVAALAFIVPKPKVPWRLLIAYGVFWGAVQFGGLFLAIHAGLPTGLSSVLAQAQAFFTLLLVSVLRWEGINRRHYIALSMAVAGLACIAIDQSQPIPFLALMSSLLGAAGWAVGNVIIRFLNVSGHRVDTLSFIAWASIVPAVLLGVFGFAIEDIGSIASLSFGNAIRAILAVTYQAIAALLLGTMAWNRLLRHYPASVVTPFSLLVPVVGISIGTGLMHEPSSPFQAVGCMFLLAALVLNVVRPSLIWKK